MKISEAVWTRVYLESHTSLDAEVCGAIIGGSEFIMARNRSANPSVSYAYETSDQKFIWSKWDRSQPMILFHSHPQGLAYPSLLDVEYARNKGVLYLIFSVKQNIARLFQIENGAIEDVVFEIDHDSPDDLYRGHHQQVMIAPSQTGGPAKCVCGHTIPDLSIADVESWWRDHVEESRWEKIFPAEAQ